MKKFFLLAALVVAAVSAHAQNKVYCSLVGTAKPFSLKMTVQVDFGQEMVRGLRVFDSRLKGEDGKPIVFNSMIDALNYMGQMGWVFEQAYVVTSAQQQVYTYIMSKDADEEGKEEGAAAPEE